MATVNIRAGAPPGQKDEAPPVARQGFEVCMGLAAHLNDSTIRARWAAYAARRRLRRKRSDSRWPAEVVV